MYIIGWMHLNRTSSTLLVSEYSISSTVILIDRQTMPACYNVFMIFCGECIYTAPTCTQLVLLTAVPPPYTPYAVELFQMVNQLTGKTPPRPCTYFDTGPAGCLSPTRALSACFMLTPARACWRTSWPRPAVAIEAWMRFWISAALLALSMASFIRTWGVALGAGTEGGGSGWRWGLVGWVKRILKKIYYKQ